jgi:hypothetical protein
MPDSKPQIVSAQVVLQPARGKAADGSAAITAETINEFLPAESTVAQVTAALRAAGFRIGPVVGTSFAISAPGATFEQVFKARLRGDGHGGMLAVAPDGSGSYELPLNGLPDAIRRQIVAITFTAPPDFGPSGLAF